MMTCAPHGNVVRHSKDTSTCRRLQGFGVGFRGGASGWGFGVGFRMKNLNPLDVRYIHLFFLSQSFGDHSINLCRSMHMQVKISKLETSK